LNKWDKRDRLVNLLPEEYLPEPEFKAFPIFAAVLIILTLLFVYMQYQGDSKRARDIRIRANQLTDENTRRMEEVQDFIEIQATARFIRSYIAVIPNMVLQAPDYWEIYNEVERFLPEDTWLQSLTFRPVGRGWPDVQINCLSRGYSFNGPLLTYDTLKGTSENPTRFRNLRMNGYRRIMVAGTPAASFTIRMGVRYPSIETEDLGG